jgi:hypothetical protein
VSKSGDGSPPSSAAKKQKKDAAEFHRKETPWPPFDLAAFARDSERSFRAAEATASVSTAPPPPFHPASIAPGPERAPASLTATIQERFEECASRVRLLPAQLRGGEMSREDAANILRLELNELELAAKSAHADSIVVMVAALRTAVEELGGIAGHIHSEPLHIVVLDDDETTRGRVALAIESMGHAVRSAASVAELGKLAAAKAPDAVVASAALHGPGPKPQFCSMVREAARAERVRVIVYANVTRAGLERVAGETGAQHSFSASAGHDGIVEQMNAILADLAW